MNPALSLTSPALYAVTHPGLVHHPNEDSWAVLHTTDGALVLLVCDGMGGMGHGDEASQLAIRELVDRLGPGADDPGTAVSAALSAIDVTVRDQLCSGGRGLPGTTAVIAWVQGGWAQIGWVGDSRAYWLRDGSVVERTRDHKLVEELMAAGQLTEAEARNSMLAHVVTRAIGGRAPEEPAVEASLAGPWALVPGDRIVLMSDGICDLVSDPEIAEAVSGVSPQDGGDRLVQLALDRGGHDNITAIVLAAEPASPAARPDASRVLGTSVPEPRAVAAPAAAAEDAAAAMAAATAATSPAPAPRSQRPPTLPPMARDDSPESEFNSYNRSNTPYIVGAVTTLTLTLALGLCGWWLLLG